MDLALLLALHTMLQQLLNLASDAIIIIHDCCLINFFSRTGA